MHDPTKSKNSPEIMKHSDGPHSTTSNVTANSLESGGVQEDSPGSQRENDAIVKRAERCQRHVKPTAEDDGAEVRAGRRQRPVKPTAEDDVTEVRAGRRQLPAKPTPRPSEFYYF